MSEPYIGEIRIFPYSFAPVGWLYCDGQTVLIREFNALFAVIGTFYGGNGNSNFALPNLQGRIPLGCGTAPGQDSYQVGMTSGSERIIVSAGELPVHSHSLQAKDGNGNSESNENKFLSGMNRKQGPKSVNMNAYISAASPLSAMAPGSLASVGGSQSHENRQPFLTVPFCIATEGLFPVRG